MSTRGGKLWRRAKILLFTMSKVKIELVLHIRKSLQPKGWFVPDLVAALPFDLLYATCSLHHLVSYNNHLVSYRGSCVPSLCTRLSGKGS